MLLPRLNTKLVIVCVCVCFGNRSWTSESSCGSHQGTDWGAAHCRLLDVSNLIACFRCCFRWHSFTASLTVNEISAGLKTAKWRCVALLLVTHDLTLPFIWHRYVLRRLKAIECEKNHLRYLRHPSTVQSRQNGSICHYNIWSNEKHNFESIT